METPDPCFEVQIHDKMDALLTAASVLDSTRLKEAERAEVARLPFVAQPLGQYKGPAVHLTAEPAAYENDTTACGPSTPLRRRSEKED